MPKKYFFIIALLICYRTAPAQEVNNIIDSFSFGEEFPDKILQTKSVVLVKVPPKSSAPHIRGNWKALAEKAQPGFKKAGIDAVAYYYIEDIYSGKEPLAAFLEEFEKRAFENIVLLIDDGSQYKLILSKFPGDGHLIKPGQYAWKIEHANLATALDKLYKLTANSDQVKRNMLILEVPEFGSLPQVIEGRRGEYYDLNFRSEKLAIPAFADTADLNEVLARYPYKYGFSAPILEDKDIRNSGYQYLLCYVHTTGKAVKQMLEYPVTNSETDFISEVVTDGKAQVKSYSVDTPVYKFYIKHIYTGDVFLGKKWDAAPTWQEALSNFVENLRTELILN